MSEREEQKTQQKNNGTLYLWGGTFFVASVIVGFCVFIALSNKKSAETPAFKAAAVATQPVKVKPRIEEKAPDVLSKIEAPVVDDVPEGFIEDTGPPQLLLDNLAGTLNLDIPFLKIRNKMPLEYTCYRNNISPAMDWAGAPSGTQSFVVFLEKKQTGEEDGFLNWILFNIPGDSSGLVRNQPKNPELENGAKHANSDHNNIGYIGPCDSKGKFTYTLGVFALDTVLDLKPYVNKNDLIRAMNGHIIDAAEQEFIHYYRL